MNKSYEILTAGFGGQGVLFVAKVLAEIGLIDGKEVTWFPAYGPAMRGGTCNCSVVVSDKPIGSPVVSHPNLLIAMNGPSYEKFIGIVASGGKAFVDSTLTDTAASSAKPADGVEIFNVPATKLAVENDLVGMANIIMLGKLIKETGFSGAETLEKAMKLVTEGKEHLFGLNMKALKIGTEQ
jgi:2-oxoglutarate ferredoxin oxidoreductase subunit gamma